MYISDFWFFKLHHRDFCQTCWEIFKYYEIMKNLKIAHFLGQFSIRNTRILQTKISHDDQHGKRKKIYISDDFFWKLCHTDLWKTYWEIFKYHEIMKNMKFARFLGQFSTRNGWKCQIKNISWGSAWKIEENEHLGFLILETSSQKFFGNIVLKS